jgi:hypothetical protein
VCNSVIGAFETMVLLMGVLDVWTRKKATRIFSDSLVIYTKLLNGINKPWMNEAF